MRFNNGDDVEAVIHEMLARPKSASLALIGWAPGGARRRQRLEVAIAAGLELDDEFGGLTAHNV